MKRYRNLESVKLRKLVNNYLNDKDIKNTESELLNYTISGEEIIDILYNIKSLSNLGNISLSRLENLIKEIQEEIRESKENIL